MILSVTVNINLGFFNKNGEFKNYDDQYKIANHFDTASKLCDYLLTDGLHNEIDEMLQENLQLFYKETREGIMDFTLHGQDFKILLSDGLLKIDNKTYTYDELLSFIDKIIG